jgi:hypothetical protein
MHIKFAMDASQFCETPALQSHALEARSSARNLLRLILSSFITPKATLLAVIICLGACTLIGCGCAQGLITNRVKTSRCLLSVWFRVDFYGSN